MGQAKLRKQLLGEDYGKPKSKPPTVKEIINQQCNEFPDDLGPKEIAGYVREAREYWDDAYATGELPDLDAALGFGLFNGTLDDLTHDPFSLKENQSDVSREIIWHPLSEEPDMFRLAEFYSGSWSMSLTENAYGHKDFTVSVNTGLGFTHHSIQAKTFVTSQVGEDGYDRWRKHVLANYQDAVSYFERQLLEHFSGQNFWSVTTNESAERLMKQFSLIHMHCKVAFLIIP
jgi:hypothetical protein